MQEPSVLHRSLSIILNERAATDPRLTEAIDALRQQDHVITTQQCEKPGHARELTGEALRRGCDTIVAAGGDGTVNEVLNGLMDSEDPLKYALGIIPYGTGNDFATAAGIPLDDPQAALDLILRREPVLIDAAQVNGHRFINVTTGGQAAEVTTSTPRMMKKILGGFAYMMNGLIRLVTLSSHKVRLKGPGFKWKGETLTLAIGNGRLAGGGYRMTPDALLNDGLLDVLIIPNVSWSEFPDLVKEFFSEESPSRADHLIYKQLPWLEVKSPKGFQINLDGEPLVDRKFRFEIVKNGIRCLLPEDCPLIC